MDELPTDRSIPILPCRSIDDQVAFYEAIGFEVTYRQKVPNAFVAVRRGAIELQFFTLKGYEPADSYSTCYVLVSDVDRLYADFRSGLKAALGRIPTRGMPRIGRLGDMSYGVRQFLLTDPGGNIIRIGQPFPSTGDEATEGSASRLERSLVAARLLMYSKGDAETAARVIDSAMASEPDASALLRLQALVIRADAAHSLGDDALATALLDEAAELQLDADDQGPASDELSRADELRAALA